MSKSKRNLAKDVDEWLKKHRKADEIVMSEISRWPLKAIYYCPIGKFVDDEMEDFEMIDLDTGEPVAINQPENLFNELNDNGATLAEELDIAFSNLLKDDVDDLEDSSETDLIIKNRRIDAITDNIIQDAAELNLDLEFLSSSNDALSELENTTGGFDTPL